MLLFVFFAVLVWYGAFVGRRRLGGIAAIAAGIAVLLAINAMHFRVAQIFGYEHLVPVFRVILYPYIALVGAVGLFMVWLPIELPRGELHCRACRRSVPGVWRDACRGEHAKGSETCAQTQTCAREACARAHDGDSAPVSHAGGAKRRR